MEEISCLQCDRIFSLRKSYHRHMKNFHPMQDIDFKQIPANACSMYIKKFHKLADFQEHLMKDHEIRFKYEELLFTPEKRI